MIGLLPWHSGKTLFYGKDIHTLKPKDVWSTISYIPQSRGFAFSYTGLEMVLLGRSAHLGAFQQPGKEEIEMAGSHDGTGGDHPSCQQGLQPDERR